MPESEPVVIETEYLPLTLQVMPTNQIAEEVGVRCRIWQGVDQQENQYVLLVHRTAALDEGSQQALEAYLQIKPTPTLSFTLKPLEGG